MPPNTCGANHSKGSRNRKRAMRTSGRRTDFKRLLHGKAHFPGRKPDVAPKTLRATGIGRGKGGRLAPRVLYGDDDTKF